MSDPSDNDTRATAGHSDGAAVLRSLEEKEMIDLINRLMLLAARKYYGSLDIEDLVMKAVIDAFAGVRTWDTNYSPFRNLWLIVRSIAFNQLKKEGRMPTYELDAEINASRTHPFLPAHPPPAEIHKTAEARRALRDLIARAVGEDDLLRRAVALFYEREVWKPKEMAAELGVSEREIYDAKRRMRRRLGKLLNKS